MPIIFVTLSPTYAQAIQNHGFSAYVIKIQDYIPDPSKKTYYVSPANSLCFMDGGIDLALSRVVFPGIEQQVKQIVKNIGKLSLLGRPYLPIGSSIIIDQGSKSLIVAPTMLLPQDVSLTSNAYYATMAVLSNILINKQEKLDQIDIIFTSFCCGYGKMDENESIRQILQGIKDWIYYKPQLVSPNIIFNEPNLLTQPKLYCNTEFFPIKGDISHTQIH